MNIDVVGLDLSLTSTGVAVGIATSTISTSFKGPRRLMEISGRISTLLSTLSHPVVVLEGYSMASKNSQAHSIGELGGVVRVALFSTGVPYVTVPPTCRAKFATGRGNASKSEVVSAVSARTGQIWSGPGADDQCDAWILQEMGMTWLGFPRFDWPKANLGGLDKVDWSPFENLVIATNSATKE